tara:strand:+ start:1200 stop:1394 length:195 start_codon:yes stop_codon:yes gene_type:complete
MDWKDEIPQPTDKQYNKFLKNLDMKNKLVQLPTELFNEIVKSAKDNDRSVNSEIKQLIKKGLRK